MDDKDAEKIVVRGDKSIQVFLTLLMIASGGNAYYTSARTADRFKGADAAALRSEIAEMRGEMRGMEKAMTTFSTSGPAEVRSALERIENELRAERLRYPKFPTNSAKR